MEGIKEQGPMNPTLRMKKIVPASVTRDCELGNQRDSRQFWHSAKSLPKAI
jgi:hypothetical protein